MSAIVPAILPKSREDLERKLALLAGLVTDVQIDVVDGRFVSPPSWPYIESATPNSAELFSEENPLPYLGKMHYEMDLMVENPEQITGDWIAAGASRITLHAESTNYLEKVIKDLEVRYGHAKSFVPGLLSFGLAINIGTQLSLIEPFLDYADYIQFMGINTIGKQGEPFDVRVLRKISQLRRKYPNVSMQVDGGVSLRTAPALLNIGVDRLIIGSGLWKAPNLTEELEKFHELVQEYGIYS